jgi:hypothetical protein
MIFFTIGFLKDESSFIGFLYGLTMLDLKVAQASSLVFEDNIKKLPA